MENVMPLLLLLLFHNYYHHYYYYYYYYHYYNYYYSLLMSGMVSRGLGPAFLTVPMGLLSGPGQLDASYAQHRVPSSP